MQIHIGVQLKIATSCLLQLDQTGCQAAIWQIAVKRRRSSIAQQKYGEICDRAPACHMHMHCAVRLNATCNALLQVDDTNFKASLGQNALDAMEVIIKRSKSVAASVARNRQANGGLAALTQDVLQVSNAERGCNPNEAEPPLVQLISSRITEWTNPI